MWNTYQVSASVDCLGHRAYMYDKDLTAPGVSKCNLMLCLARPWVSDSESVTFCLYFFLYAFSMPFKVDLITITDCCHDIPVYPS